MCALHFVAPPPSFAAQLLPVDLDAVHSTAVIHSIALQGSRLAVALSAGEGRSVNVYRLATAPVLSAELRATFDLALESGGEGGWRTAVGWAEGALLVAAGKEVSVVDVREES